MRVVFLDIDGVLNSDAWFASDAGSGVLDNVMAGDDWRDGHIDPEAVQRLNTRASASGSPIPAATSSRACQSDRTASISAPPMALM